MVSFNAVSVLFLLAGAAVAAPAPAPVEQSAQAGDFHVHEINKYRAEMRPTARKAMTFSSQLQANALKTVRDDNGTMKHELNPGSFAQVLAGGKCTDDGFVSALVQGWICERPSLLPAGTCKDGVYKHNGQTGHADILSSTGYTKAGCACYKDIWGCDFA